MNRESTEINPARTRSLIRYSVLRVRDDPPVLRDPNVVYAGPHSGKAPTEMVDRGSVRLKRPFKHVPVTKCGF